MNKGFGTLYILISLAVVATAMGAYVVQKTVNFQPKAIQQPIVSRPQPTPTPTPQADTSLESKVEAETTGWKTYTNSKYGYSIMYPNTWIIDEGESDGIIILGMGKGSNGGFSHGGQSVLIEITHFNSTNLEYIKTEIAPTSNPLKIGDVSLGGSVGEKWSFNDNSDDDNYAIFFNKNGKRYVVIKESSNKSQFKEYHLEIDQVISTFKFIPQTSDRETFMFNGQEITVKRVGSGEYCEGRISPDNTFTRCSEGLKCKFAEQSVQDAPGKCVKE